MTSHGNVVQPSKVQVFKYSTAVFKGRPTNMHTSEVYRYTLDPYAVKHRKNYPAHFHGIFDQSMHAVLKGLTYIGGHAPRTRNELTGDVFVKQQLKNRI